jgi:hypothetical protein
MKFKPLKMYVDPQSDVYAQLQKRKAAEGFPYRLNWEFQEQTRQHAMLTHAPDIINTAAFMNAPPKKFPQWTTPDIEERIRTEPTEKIYGYPEDRGYGPMSQFLPNQYGPQHPPGEREPTDDEVWADYKKWK